VIESCKRSDRSGLWRLERWPAPVFFMPASALLAGAVKHPLRDVLPDRVATIQPDCIGGLDFHGSLAAAAGDAQDVALDFRKTSLPHLSPGHAGARVFENPGPKLRGAAYGPLQRQVFPFASGWACASSRVDLSCRIRT
jgi:hypothetical protein